MTETLAALGRTDWLALTAAGVSLVSLGLALRADRRAGRAEQRAAKAEQRDEERAERERHQAGAAGRELVAKLHLLVEDSDPGNLLFLANIDHERAVRAGADLWRRWRELKEPLHVFGTESAPKVTAAVRQAATHVALSIQMTRTAIDAAADEAVRTSSKADAEQTYTVARSCVSDLELALPGRSLGELLDEGETRRT